MDSTKEPDNGIVRTNRLVPGQVDIVLGSHPGRMAPPRPPQPRAYGLTLLCAVLAILCLCLLFSQFKRHAPQLLPATHPSAVISK